MDDVFFLAITFIAFASFIAFVRICERL